MSPRLSLDLADVMIRRIFFIGLSLAQADSVVTGPARKHLETVIAQLDALVQEIHTVALTEHAAFAGDPADPYSCSLERPIPDPFEAAEEVEAPVTST